MVVSIGPFHHGDPKLLPMEEQKLRYLQALRNRASNKDLSGYIGVIKEHENTIREYYAENITTSGDEFTIMVLLDSAFVIKTFLKYNGIHDVEETDRIFSRPGLISQVIRDMKLLENQLPFFILEKIYNFVIHTKSQGEFITMTFKFFKVAPRVSITNEIKHFVDLFRTISLPKTLRDPSKDGRTGEFRGRVTELQEAEVVSKENDNHFMLGIEVDNEGDGRESSRKVSDPSKDTGIGFRVRVTELQEAGVRFEKINKHSFLDIEFDGKGILKIPPLKLHDDTDLSSGILWHMSNAITQGTPTSLTTLLFWISLSTLPRTWRRLFTARSSRIGLETVRKHRMCSTAFSSSLIS